MVPLGVPPSLTCFGNILRLLSSGLLQCVKKWYLFLSACPDNGWYSFLSGKNCSGANSNVPRVRTRVHNFLHIIDILK